MNLVTSSEEESEEFSVYFMLRRFDIQKICFSESTSHQFESVQLSKNKTKTAARLMLAQCS